MSEKVEYFGNKDIMIYMIVCFGMGMVIGMSFAHYKNFRFDLISSKISAINKKHIELENGHKEIQSKDRLKINEEIKKLKGRSFDTGCTIQDGEYYFNTSYRVPPKVMLGMNGMLVNSTTKLGQWIQNVDYTVTKDFINITSIKPAAQEIHVCWLAIPDLEGETPKVI